MDSRASAIRIFSPRSQPGKIARKGEARAPEGSVDIGTGYDCTDVKGHTTAPSITPDQRAWRKRLLTAMARQGFVNYPKEWWHFSLPGAGRAGYDFPIQPRTR